MPSDQSPSPPQSTPNSGRRRSSFVDMFGPRSAGVGNGQSSNPPRRLSITTLGLSTMPGAQTAGGFGNHRSRGESISSANSGSVDESPFEDDSNSTSGTSLPTSPFARRMSFGAKALREVRNSPSASGNANGRPSVSSSTAAASTKLTSPTAKGREGFDFAENLRSRAERTSITGAAVNHLPPPQQIPHQRAKSVATMEPPKAQPVKQRAIPDAMGERILKGDFYMD